MSLDAMSWAMGMHLDPVEKLILIWCANNRAWEARPIHADVLAEFAGVDADTASAALEILVAEGLVLCISGDRFRVNYELVEAWGVELSSRITAALASSDSPLRARHPVHNGFVYFLRASEVGRIKIGTSRSPGVRLAALAKQAPYKLDLLKVVAGGKEREAEIHERFADLREVGEWFRESRELLAYIDSLRAFA